MTQRSMRLCCLGGLGAVIGVLSAGLAFYKWNHAAATSIASPAGTPSILSSPAPISDDDFVGTATCGTCHTRIWRQYRESPMGRSLAAPLEAVPQSERYDLPEFAPPGPRRYRVEREADLVRHLESLVDASGHVIYDQAMTVSYALGSGKRGRAYLFEQEGMLFKSSIAWFTDRNEWGLAPDYLPDSHRRFDRRITEGCIDCHAGRMSVNREAPDKFGTPAVIDAAIGCERCHGPGRRHVEAHEAATGRNELAEEWIVNPARLDSRRQVSICAQCHLHGEARVMRTGQRPCDFQPGRLLEENRIVFVAQAGTSAESGKQALSQVEQMLASACYRGSAGRMGCTSCHDPHGNPEPESRVEFYRARCLACHETRGCQLPVAERLAQNAVDSCHACHMPPSLKLRNVLHVSFADHRIPRDASRSPDQPETVARADESLAVFDHGDERLSKLEVDRARAFVMVGGAEHVPPTVAGAREAEKLLLPVIKVQPGDLDALDVLAGACLMQGRLDDAERYWQTALQLDPQRESVLRGLGMLCYEQRRMEPARDYLRRYLAVNSRYGFMHAKYAGALGAVGEWRESIAAAERALELNPTLAAAHELLAYAYEKIGNPAQSQRHRELFQRVQKLLPRASPEE